MQKYVFELYPTGHNFDDLMPSCSSREEELCNDWFYHVKENYFFYKHKDY